MVFKKKMEYYNKQNSKPISLKGNRLTFYACCIFSKALTDTTGVIRRAVENAFKSLFFAAFGTDIPKGRIT